MHKEVTHPVIPRRPAPMETLSTDAGRTCNGRPMPDPSRATTLGIINLQNLRVFASGPAPG